MITFVGWLATLVALGLLWWRLEPVVHRLVALAEQRETNAHARDLRASEPRPTAASVPSMAIPQDLASWAAGWGDAFAREQALDAIREQYAKLGSWEMVRLHFGLTLREGAPQ